jgi:hypothetical protein
VVGDAGASELLAELVLEAGHGLVVAFPAAEDEAELDTEAEVGGVYALRLLAPGVVGAGAVVVCGEFIVATTMMTRLRGHIGEVRHGGQWQWSSGCWVVMRREQK